MAKHRYAHGKILRIDVKAVPVRRPASIHSGSATPKPGSGDGSATRALSFDAHRRLYIEDVDGLWEEVDVQPAGVAEARISWRFSKALTASPDERCNRGL